MKIITGNTKNIHGFRIGTPVRVLKRESKHGNNTAFVQQIHWFWRFFNLELCQWVMEEDMTDAN